MRLSQSEIALGLAAAFTIASVLQGCGGGGSPTPAPPPTPAPTPAPPKYPDNMKKGPRTPPLDPQEAVDYLNKLFMGNYPKESPNASKGLGVTISMAAQGGPNNKFSDNLFCNTITGDRPCYMGSSDCRMSASLFNWQVIVKGKGEEASVSPTFGRPSGYVFNQSMVMSSLMKCSYLFDGADQNKLNNGCGMGAKNPKCGAGDAFSNICESTGKLCTGLDPEVTGNLCDPYSIPPTPGMPPPTKATGVTCMYSGPAMNYPDMKPAKVNENHLLHMVETRLKIDKDEGTKPIDLEQHNEVVIDEQLMIPAMWLDPALVIPAFIVVQSDAENPLKRSLSDVVHMRDTYQTEFQVGDKKIPVVQINDVTPFGETGPFQIPKGLEALEKAAKETTVV